MTRPRGFTLIEAMVTLAIAGIISAAAAGAMSLIMRSVATTRVNVSVATNLANSVQFISRDIENAGGQGMPTQAGLIIENDTCAARDGFPACNGSDRITVITALEEPPICTVRAGSNDRLSFQYGQGGCCFPSKLASEAVTGVAMLSRTDGSFRPVTITGDTSTACEFNVVDLLPQALYLNNPVAALHEAVALTNFTSFIGGQAILAQARTYYLDTAAHELRVRTGAGATADDALVTDEIWDLQMAVGLDLDNDGTVAATEWAYRGSTGVATNVYATRLFAPRQVEVSVVQGVPSTSGNGAVVSPLRTGSQTIVAEGRALRAGVALLTPFNSMLRVKP